MGNSLFMSGRVSASVLTAIGMPELITENIEEYGKLSKELALNTTFYNSIREKLVKTCLARKPRNPYWDMERYVRNLEKGYDEAYYNFMSGNQPRHIFISEDNYIGHKGEKKNKKKNNVCVEGKGKTCKK